MKSGRLMQIVVCFAGLVIFAGCASSTPSTSYTYTSTTSKGDLVNYTITANSVTVQWEVTGTTGGIQFTWNVTGTCGDQNMTYGYRTCTIGTATCTAGSASCPVGTPSGNFDMLEIPATALLVHIPAAVATTVDGGTHEELHSGFISGGCPPDVSGDYAYIKIGRANASNSADTLFGIYRTDAAFNSVTHADFGMITGTGGTGALNTAVTSFVNNPANLPGVESMVGNTCTNGVFLRSDSGQLFRLNITNSGTFVLDMPSGQGGIVSFKTTNAASLLDISNRNWWGIQFPDNGSPTLMSVTTGAVISGAIAVTGQTMSGGTISSVSIKPATGGAVLTPTGKFASPSTDSSNNAEVYATSGNALQSTYATPANIPGLYQIDDGTNGNVIAIFSKVGSQIMMYGVVFNYRDNTGAGCSPGTVGTCHMRNSGNFLAFTH